MPRSRRSTGAAVELVVFQLGEYAKTLSVALEAEKVAAFAGNHIVQPARPAAWLKPVANGVLAGVAERRLPMSWARQADCTTMPKSLAHTSRAMHRDHFTDAHTQRTTDAADSAVNGSGGGMWSLLDTRLHLGLAAQTTESAGEDDAVMVFMEGRGPIHRHCAGFAESFAVVEQGLPIQS